MPKNNNRGPMCNTKLYPLFSEADTGCSELKRRGENVGPHPLVVGHGTTIGSNVAGKYTVRMPINRSGDYQELFPCGIMSVIEKGGKKYLIVMCYQFLDGKFYEPKGRFVGTDANKLPIDFGYNVLRSAIGSDSWMRCLLAVPPVIV